MNLKKILFLPILFLLVNCNQKKEKPEKVVETKSELITQTEYKTRDLEKELSEFAMSYSPNGASALDSIPKNIIEDFKELRIINKEAHEKNITLIFTKLYAEHLQCCHQSYIIEQFPRNTSKYDFEKLTMINEFAFMTGYLENDNLPEIWTSGIIEKWLTENPRLLKYEPIGKYDQFIKTVSKKIVNGDYWDN